MRRLALVLLLVAPSFAVQAPLCATGQCEAEQTYADMLGSMMGQLEWRVECAEFSQQCAEAVATLQYGIAVTASRMAGCYGSVHWTSRP